MILVDTNLVIDAVRTNDQRLFAAFAQFQAAICGAVRAEILHGARTPADVQRYLAALNAFAFLDMPDAVWDIVGDNLRRMSKAGIPMSFPDAVIVAISIHHNVALWTRDTAIRRAVGIVPGLTLFDESVISP